MLLRAKYSILLENQRIVENYHRIVCVKYIFLSIPFILADANINTLWRNTFLLNIIDFWHFANVNVHESRKICMKTAKPVKEWRWDKKYWDPQASLTKVLFRKINSRRTTKMEKFLQQKLYGILHNAKRRKRHNVEPKYFVVTTFHKWINIPHHVFRKKAS